MRLSILITLFFIFGADLVVYRTMEVSIVDFLWKYASNGFISTTAGVTNSINKNFMVVVAADDYYEKDSTPSRTLQMIPTTLESENKEPSGSPSWSFYPSSAPSVIPTELSSSSVNPSTSLSDTPSDNAPLSDTPSDTPSFVPSFSFYPSATPSDVPTVSAMPSMIPSVPPNIVPSFSIAPSDSPTETDLPTVDLCNIELSVTTILCEADTASITIAIAWPIIESKGQLLKVSPVIEVDSNIRNNKTTTIFPGQEFFLMQGGLAEESFVVPAEIDFMDQFNFTITIMGLALGNPNIDDRNCMGKVQTNCTPSKEEPPTGVPVDTPVAAPTEMPSPRATLGPTIITGTCDGRFTFDFCALCWIFLQSNSTTNHHCIHYFSCR